MFTMLGWAHNRVSAHQAITSVYKPPGVLAPGVAPPPPGVEAPGVSSHRDFLLLAEGVGVS